MKKISKTDWILFLCIMIGCVFGLAFMAAEWILSEEVIWFELLTAIFLGLPSCVLMGWFLSDILVRMLNNHKEKKKNKEK